MLVLSRKPGESVRIGDDVTVTVIEFRGNAIRIGIDAPRPKNVVRTELLIPAGSTPAYPSVELEAAAELQDA